MDSVSIYEQMVEDMKETGLMANSTVKENTYFLIAQSRLVFGTMASESNGWMKMRTLQVMAESIALLLKG